MAPEPIIKSMSVMAVKSKELYINKKSNDHHNVMAVMEESSAN